MIFTVMLIVDDLFSVKSPRGLLRYDFHSDV